MYHYSSDVENSNGYGTWKKRDDQELDNGFIILLGPGGRAAVVTKQIPERAPQSPNSQTSSSTVLVPLSSSGEVSATVAEASDSPLGVLPSTSTPETSPTLVSASTNEGGIATESSLQTAISSTVSSEAVNGKPSVYVGIVLGTIAGIACLTALIAWWIRIRSHAKRRRLYGDTDIPWAPSESVDGGLEEAREVMQACSREDLARVESWEPRRNGEIDEPRRFERHPNGCIDSSRSSVLADDDPYAHSAGAANPDNDLAFVQPCRNGPYPNARPLPSYLRSINSSSSGSVDDHSTASSLGPLRVANLLPGDCSAATSRAGTVISMNNQTYSLGSEDIEDLINVKSSSMLDRRTNSTFSWMDTTAVLRDTMSEKNETQNTSTAVREGWGTSLRSIFAAMASNLSTRSSNVRRNDDTFTSIPRKRSVAAPSSDLNAGQELPRIFLSGRRGTKPRQLRRDLLSRNGSDNTPSRASSVYSTASANYQCDQFGETPTNPSWNFSQDINNQTRSKEMSRSRPRVIMRASSTGLSVASTQLTDKEDPAESALVDRRRWARMTSVEWEGRGVEDRSG